MYLIVGLGNPEQDYANTRHNMGFDVINEVAKRNNIVLDRKKYNSFFGQGNVSRKRALLLKPQTYMNLSGIAIKDFKNFFKIPDDKIIVIYDDVDIEEGKIKIRKLGGSGSHNGMISVVQELGNKNFYRIRIGVGKPFITQELKNYVLEKIDEETREKLNNAIHLAAEAVEDIIEKGIDYAMNKYN